MEHNTRKYPNIVALFEHAAIKLKYPKITFTLPSGAKLKLNRAGNAAKFPGSINLTDGGRYGDNVWYGRIHKDGTLDCRLNLPAEVQWQLNHFESSPQQSAKMYGQMYNHCCFCGAELTNAISVKLGYGPICAEHFGLPHELPEVNANEIEQLDLGDL